ncbi:hypothetical protein D3C76_1310750 [compost metagenome]
MNEAVKPRLMLWAVIPVVSRQRLSRGARGRPWSVAGCGRVTSGQGGGFLYPLAGGVCVFRSGRRGFPPGGTCRGLFCGMTHANMGEARAGVLPAVESLFMLG